MVEPYIWLQDNEGWGDASCGCKLVERWNGDPGSAFFQCPLHASAGKLLEALKMAETTVQLVNRMVAMNNTLAVIKEAVNAAKEKPND